MKKIYEAYRSNRISFYLILCIYSEVIFAFCFGLLFSVLSAELPPPGSPHLITTLSPPACVIYIIIMVAGAGLLLVPSVWLTIKAVRERIKAGYIFAIWVCEAAACALGFVLVLNDWSLAGKLSEFLVDFFDDSFGIFVTREVFM